MDKENLGQTPQTPAPGENRENETSFNTGNPKTAAFWENHWYEASTRMHVARAISKALAPQDPKE